MKNKPCAFCGSVEKDNPRTKGHILQDSMYPETGFEKVQRMTVPECRRCSAIWQDAEDQFRSLMVIAGDENEYASAMWDGPIRRAHGREEDGLQRQRDLFKWIVTKQSPTGPEHTLYLASIEEVYRVIRKMVRGLCYYHRFTTQVADHQVLAMQYENEPPADTKPTVFNYLPGIFRYSHFSEHEIDGDIHMSWLLTFYERVSFIGLVSAQKVSLGSPRRARNPDT